MLENNLYFVQKKFNLMLSIVVLFCRSDHLFICKSHTIINPHWFWINNLSILSKKETHYLCLFSPILTGICLSKWESLFVHIFFNSNQIFLYKETHYLCPFFLKTHYLCPFQHLETLIWRPQYWYLTSSYKTIPYKFCS